MCQPSHARRGDQRDGARSERLPGDHGSSRLGGGARAGNRGGRGDRARAAGGVTWHRTAQVGEDCSRRSRRQRRGERAQVGLTRGDRGREPLAGRAIAQMCAHTPAPEHPSVPIGDSPAHVLTLHCAPIRELDQRLACLEDRLLGPRGRRPERDGDLLVWETAHLA
jgi:hypothetical protein